MDYQNDDVNLRDVFLQIVIGFYLTSNKKLNCVELDPFHLARVTLLEHESKAINATQIAK